MLVGVGIVVAFNTSTNMESRREGNPSGFRAARNAAGGVDVARIMRRALAPEPPTVVADAHHLHDLERHVAELDRLRRSLWLGGAAH